MVFLECSIHGVKLQTNCTRQLFFFFFIYVFTEMWWLSLFTSLNNHIVLFLRNLHWTTHIQFYYFPFDLLFYLKMDNPWNQLLSSFSLYKWWHFVHYFNIHQWISLRKKHNGFFFILHSAKFTFTHSLPFSPLFYLAFTFIVLPHIQIVKT